METEDDAALIELAYTVSTMAILDKAKLPPDKPVAGVIPADVERECYRLATQFGLRPAARIDNMDTLQKEWRGQLKQERQREIFDLGMLLVRQHSLMSALQGRPNIAIRPQMELLVKDIRGKLRQLLTRLRMTQSIEKLPPMPPWKGDEWMSWSGDALKVTALEELRGARS